MARTQLYKKGQSGNPAGKPKGTRNKLTGKSREMIQTILESNEKKFKENMDKLKPFEFCRIYLELLPYVIPKHRAIDLSLDFERLTDTDIEQIYQRLKNSLK